MTGVAGEQIRAKLNQTSSLNQEERDFILSNLQNTLTSVSSKLSNGNSQTRMLGSQINAYEDQLEDFEKWFGKETDSVNAEIEQVPAKLNDFNAQIDSLISTSPLPSIPSSFSDIESDVDDMIARAS